MILDYGNCIDYRLLEWLNQDESKITNVLQKLGEPVKEQLEYRAVPFNRVSEGLVV